MLDSKFVVVVCVVSCIRLYVSIDDVCDLVGEIEWVKVFLIGFEEYVIVVVVVC